MHLYLSLHGVLLIACLSSLAVDAGAVAGGPKTDYRVGERLPQAKSTVPLEAGYKEIAWDALIPADWDPRQAFKGIDLGALTDADPRAIDALQRLKETWDNALVVSSLRGQRIRIAGFMVPLERKGEEVTEFLLVPYFGACIHVPPPPANQIIHVLLAKPLKGAQSMDAVWVSGTMDIARSDSAWGVAGYRMKGDIITPYRKR